MRRVKGALAILAMSALVGGIAGCVDSEPEEAQTPAGASTVRNAAAQTDSEGNPVTAPMDTGGSESQPGGDTAAGDPEAVALGEMTFTQICQSCHLNLGQEMGVGPVISQAGLGEEFIRTRIIEGAGAMPANLVEGEDLDNVVAWVLSIQ